MKIKNEGKLGINFDHGLVQIKLRIKMLDDRNIFALI